MGERRRGKRGRRDREGGGGRDREREREEERERKRGRLFLKETDKSGNRCDNWPTGWCSDLGLAIFLHLDYCKLF